MRLVDLVDREAMMVPRDVVEKVIDYIKSIAPRGTKIILLSHSGARAYGWGTKRNDYDIHGVICCKGYFDYVHSGYFGVDLNLHEVYHLNEIILRYHHGETIVNLANPVYSDYIDPKVFLNLTSREFFSYDSIESEIVAGLESGNERMLLHGLRRAMVAVHYFNTGEWVVSLPDLWETYGLQEEALASLIRVYRSRSGLSDEVYTFSMAPIDSIRSAVRRVLDMLREALEKKAKPFDWDEFERVRGELYKLYDVRPKCRIKIPGDLESYIADLRVRRFKY
jgi:hypothetical protein